MGLRMGHRRYDGYSSGVASRRKGGETMGAASARVRPSVSIDQTAANRSTANTTVSSRRATNKTKMLYILGNDSIQGL